MRHYSDLPPGGRTHLSVDGALTVNESAMYQSELAAHTGLSGVVPSMPMRGRPGLKQLSQGPGGTDHIVLGEDNMVYECGTKEAHFRITQDEGLRRAAAAEPAAGGRAVERERKTERMVGGADHMSEVWSEASGPGAYSEGMDNAQRRVAWDPEARSVAAAMEVAGRRVERAHGLRVTRPVGGADTTSLTWDTPEGTASARSASSSAASVVSDAMSSQRLLRPEQPVGGHSAAYLAGPPPSRMGGVFNYDAPPSPAGQDAGGRGVRRVPTAPVSSVGAMLSMDAPRSPGGRPGTAASVMAGSPRAPRAQPVGGRGLLATGLHGIDDVDARVGSRATAPHAVSNVMFG